jgi:hypothetical protein
MQVVRCVTKAAIAFTLAVTASVASGFGIEAAMLLDKAIPI